jgi:3-deoxy-D-manno-octulosonate 8-phosphate phosphatase (KDO 8-P phosphatase)
MKKLTHPAEALVLTRTSEALIERLVRIKLMVFDIDGVLTDGSLWYGDEGEVFKRFHAHDGHGLKMMLSSGIRVALITGRTSKIVSLRAAELGIADVMQDVRDKGQALSELVSRQFLSFEEVGFMGDDLIDIPAMQKVGFAASVPDAPPYIAQAAHWVSSKAGGHGAVRECCDLILASQGKLGPFFQPGLLGSGVIQ